MTNDELLTGYLKKNVDGPIGLFFIKFTKISIVIFGIAFFLLMISAYLN